MKIKLKTRKKGLFRVPLVLNVKKVFNLLLNVKVLGIASPKPVVMVGVTPRPWSLYERGEFFNNSPTPKEVYLPILTKDKEGAEIGRASCRERV